MASCRISGRCKAFNLRYLDTESDIQRQPSEQTATRNMSVQVIFNNYTYSTSDAKIFTLVVAYSCFSVRKIYSSGTTF